MTTVANNDALDSSVDGVASTLAALRERKIASHGANEGEASADRALCGEERVRVGILAHTFY